MNLEHALSNVPTKFRNKLIGSYLEIKERASQASFRQEYDSSGLSIGKFCEVVLRLLQHELTGQHVPFGQHIKNFITECIKLEQVDKSIGNESLRIIIPRAITFLYTIRNKRAIGHIGGDVEANGIDMATSVRITDWVICELIRIYHKLSLEEAQDIIDTISSRSLPIIWEINGKKRILRTDLTVKQKVLVLLYSDPQNTILLEDLFDWVEYSSMSMFKTAVLGPLHTEKFIEFNKNLSTIHISPLGIKEVEDNILKTS